MTNMIIYFITGGLVTTSIIVLEQSGFRLLSGLMALIPVFTLVSYIFIGNTEGGLAVTQHAKFVLWGTIISWIPYMIAVVYLSPKIGPTKAIIVGMIIFFILATIFTLTVNHFGFFK